MTATNPELLSVSLLSVSENLGRLDGLLAVSYTTMQTLYKRLKEHDEADAFDSLIGCAAFASGLLEIASDMRGIVSEIQERCLQDE